MNEQSDSLRCSQSRAWIEGKAKAEDAVKILMRLNRKMIEPGKILHVAAISLGGGSMHVSIYKVDAVTHIKTYRSGGGENLHAIYSEISEDQIRELIEY